MAEFLIKKSDDESITKTIRLKSSLIDAINELANENDISFNALIVQMCEFALANIPGAKTDEVQIASETTPPTPPSDDSLEWDMDGPSA